MKGARFVIHKLLLTTSELMLMWSFSERLLRMGSGCQGNKICDEWVGTFSLHLHGERRAGDRVLSPRAHDLTHQSCPCNEASIKTLAKGLGNFWVQRSWDSSSAPGEGTEALCPSHRPCPPKLICLLLICSLYDKWSSKKGKWFSGVL